MNKTLGRLVHWGHSLLALSLIALQVGCGGTTKGLPKVCEGGACAKPPIDRQSLGTQECFADGKAMLYMKATLNQSNSKRPWQDQLAGMFTQFAADPDKTGSPKRILDMHPDKQDDILTKRFGRFVKRYGVKEGPLEEKRDFEIHSIKVLMMPKGEKCQPSNHSKRYQEAPIGHKSLIFDRAENPFLNRTLN